MPRVDEALADVSEADRRLVLAEAGNVGALLPDTRCQLDKMTIRRHQVEASEPLRTQKVHGVDDRRDIGGVLANRVRKISMWPAFIEWRNLGLAVEPRAGAIAVDPPHAGAIDFCGSIEQHGKLARAVGSSVMPGIVSANYLLVFAGLPGVPTIDPRDVEN